MRITSAPSSEITMVRGHTIVSIMVQVEVYLDDVCEHGIITREKDDSLLGKEGTNDL